MENNTQVQNAPDTLTEEQRYKEFTIELISRMTDLNLIQRSFRFVHNLFLNDTGATLDRSPQAKERRELLKDISHYCEHIPTEQLTRIRNICHCMYNTL
ncbi:MAG: hypothetical protein UD936_05765 [Acutalibacteraceae bacterium]|nr:hypothetical protein [Acutalibacteraceae bacterium]